MFPTGYMCLMHEERSLKSINNGSPSLVFSISFMRKCEIDPKGVVHSGFWLEPKTPKEACNVLR